MSRIAIIGLGVFQKWDKLRDKNQYSEFLSKDKTLQEINAAGMFPNIPLTVITGGKAPPRIFASKSAFEVHMNNQKELANLSSIGTHVIAEKSGHFLQHSEPDLIVNEIEKLLHKK